MHLNLNNHVLFKKVQLLGSVTYSRRQWCGVTEFQCALQALFKALGLNDNDFKFGLTKVFFRPGKVKKKKEQIIT